MLMIGEPEFAWSLDRSCGWSQTTSVCFLSRMSLMNNKKKDGTKKKKNVRN